MDAQRLHSTSTVIIHCVASYTQDRGNFFDRAAEARQAKNFTLSLCEFRHARRPSLFSREKSTANSGRAAIDIELNRRIVEAS
jgi:hypothetical protein